MTLVISVGDNMRHCYPYVEYSCVEFDCLQFLLRVSILLLTRDIDIVILSVRLSVRLSVCLSVTRWYCMKTA